ncbi:MAG: fumarylacetoacetate hydrolase family protein [Candidatus Dadabacteria bacterium]|nr:fumarylacetoacetate hydrolase family protein [Candidatus Dadabacteria bacterium]MDE0663255.1 fumarylacetoacetate hydrolase family protein [Candidatus Dadabacteria bacterium]
MKFLRFRNSQEKPVFGKYIDGAVFEIEGNIFGNWSVTNTEHNYTDIEPLAPCLPTKIIAVGLNYEDHAREMKRTPPEDPMLFMKPSTAVIAHREEIKYPAHMSERVDYEGELGVVIGKKARMVEEERALEYVFGYTCINDVTARDLQAKDIQFTRGKGFDTFAPVGPFIETKVDPGNLRIKTFLNGEIKQDSSTKNLIFSVPKLISFISGVMTLLPGDMIATGTPSGVSPMKPLDVVEVEIEGIGKLENRVSL